MGSSIRKAIELILSADPELLNILSTTARVCLTSSILALLIGVPLGILLGAERFPGRRVLLVLNRTLIGMPPVVCGLLFYMLFSGVGPFRHLHWLFTVKLMILASDLSENTLDKFRRLCERENIEYRVCLDAETLSLYAGEEGKGIFGITDQGFADVIRKEIDLMK